MWRRRPGKPGEKAIKHTKCVDRNRAGETWTEEMIRKGRKNYVQRH